MRVVSAVLLIFSCLTASASPRSLATETAFVTVYPNEITGKLYPQLFGVNLNINTRALITNPSTVELVRKLRFGSIRFPNGCQADWYNWRDPGNGQVTVDDFLRFCEAVGAEPYYTVNMQGGTEGKDGPVPEGAPLDEKIKYKHTAPNPCGDTDYVFDTLDDARQLVRRYTVERALSGEKPLLHYEMGNENWGQSRTDFPPDVYARTVEVFAIAMREVLDTAKKSHPELAKLKLHITAVGYPIMGNNMKMVDTPDYKINKDWTQRLNSLARSGVIDAVQEHFYPYGNADGGTLVWASHNLRNILLARAGVANHRLGGYKDPNLAYKMPIEFTEWNVKCWGTPPTPQKLIENPGFEQELTGWVIAGTGTVRSSTKAARRGEKGIAVSCPADGWSEIVQRFAKGDFAYATFGAWVRTNKPSAVRLFVREPEGRILGEAVSPPNADMWQRVSFGAKLDDAREFEVVLRVEGEATAWFDEVSFHTLKTTSGVRPMSSETFEQQLFCVDALRVMAEGGSHRAHLHHLFGNYPCGLLNMDGSKRDNAKVYEFFAGLVGDRLIKSVCKSPTFRYDHAGRAYATDFNALAPPVEDVSAFSVQASRTNTHLFLLMINRYPDRDIVASIDLGLTPISDTGKLRILSGDDIDLPGCTLRETSVSVARRLKHRIGPYSAELLAIRVK